MTDLMTTSEVAEQLRLDRETVCEMLRDGIIRGFKARDGASSHWRVQAHDLKTYIESRMSRSSVSP